MLHRLFLSLLLVAACPLALFAAAEESAPPMPATSKIVHVTVYPNSALVTREVEVPAGAGAAELVVTPLPPQTINSSLYSEGSDGIRVLTTRFRTRAIKEDTREEVRKIEDQLKTLTLANQKLQADSRTIEQNMQMLAKLENFAAVSATSSTEKGTLNGENVIALAKYVMESRAEKAKELVGLQQQMQDNQEQINYLQRQRNELSAGSSKTERDAVIVVEKSTPAAGKVRLNYLVSAASWRPQYKLRAGQDEKEPVQLEYLAALLQQTGEDWSHVDLVLSTAEPMLNAAPPDLKMLAVAVMDRNGVQQAAFTPSPPGQAIPQFSPNAPSMPMPVTATQPSTHLKEQAKSLRMQAQQELNEKQETRGNLLYNQASAFDQADELINSDPVSVLGMRLAKPRNANEGPTVSYHLSTKLSVPSRNDEQVVEITRIEMTPEYYYKAIPVLTPHVYRLANLTNKSKTVLLPGEGTMYQGSDFVGRMNLPLVAIGEQFTAGFGVDPQLQVQRQMIDKSRTSQGGNQVLSYQYRILVNSYKTEPVKLQVWDRLPHAEAEAMAVTLVKATPEICADPLYVREDRPKNLLRWDVKVDPTMNGEKAMSINYEFKLELDRQMIISSFTTR
ncbi:MAG: mucoidy inhibitor MuiA family protein [Gemmataceae bacterium]